ncbi:hypothetical protein CAOG_05320 [Capsaspora owczarzaki ATCC 30864]|uniref:Uncharacterized protein n=1 Tax=Capsaspora owczarzaki (strain ATCC 30864) TaxID=595528 RepID=A0A0D2VTT5_CAPO3|nr:hypothetical protein CAOG_05320 [Capsaspora owczarzaki ATCC 30864]KJE94722.1 hypothetical protein CAOG_005320 [Capsaspora owczarzaki ATCC 30864]|eukprot:XP_004347005.2 hypothetical protein CAOG_05320 [Capsaspora owczarzaki ATCC 30864]
MSAAMDSFLSDYLSEKSSEAAKSTAVSGLKPSDVAASLFTFAEDDDNDDDNERSSPNAKKAAAAAVSGLKQDDLAASLFTLAEDRRSTPTTTAAAASVADGDDGDEGTATTGSERSHSPEQPAGDENSNRRNVDAPPPTPVKPTVDDDVRRRYNALISKAKSTLATDQRRALALYQEAYALVPLPKLAQRIAEIQSKLNDESAAETAETAEKAENSENYVELAQDFFVPHATVERMFPHQREGVIWLYSLFQRKTGGILGDDMGLGKTIQIVSFLQGLFCSKQIKRALIVVPLALLDNWKKEFEKWAPEVAVWQFHDGDLKQRHQVLRSLRKRGGVCLTTYGIVCSRNDGLRTIDERVDGGSAQSDDSTVWDCMILDEGHRIKNCNTKLARAVYNIMATTKVILSGTPIQNNLKEMWALFNFVCDGKLLGTIQSFGKLFNQPIVQASDKSATDAERLQGATVAAVLRDRIAPYFLRREKKQVLHADDGTVFAAQAAADLADAPGTIAIKLERKDDLIVWLKLAQPQLKLYTAFLENTDIDELINEGSTVLSALVMLKKLCDHPQLLKLTTNKSDTKDLRILAAKKCDDDDEDEERQQERQTARAKLTALEVKKLWQSFLPRTAEQIEDTIQASVKLSFLTTLCENLKQDGHRVLIFSQSTRMLDLIQEVLTYQKYSLIRIDGSVTGHERQHRIDKFNTDDSIFGFLLTTQVGGVGITLTSADRVIIVDPSWNPAIDTQAVDRAYRIGQTRNVVIYRLITCGTIEEKIYCRQVYKSDFSHVMIDKHAPSRHFDASELYQLFEIGETSFSTTQKELSAKYDGAKIIPPWLADHFATLKRLDVRGTNFHDLLSNSKVKDTEEAVDQGVLEEAKRDLDTSIIEDEDNNSAPLRRPAGPAVAKPAARKPRTLATVSAEAELRTPAATSKTSKTNKGNKTKAAAAAAAAVAATTVQSSPILVDSPMATTKVSVGVMSPMLNALLKAPTKSMAAESPLPTNGGGKRVRRRLVIDSDDDEEDTTAPAPSKASLVAPIMLDLSADDEDDGENAPSERFENERRVSVPSPMLSPVVKHAGVSVDSLPEESTTEYPDAYQAEELQDTSYEDNVESCHADNAILPEYSSAQSDQSEDGYSRDAADAEDSTGAVSVNEADMLVSKFSDLRVDVTGTPDEEAHEEQVPPAAGSLEQDMLDALAADFMAQEPFDEPMPFARGRKSLGARLAEAAWAEMSGLDLNESLLESEDFDTANVSQNDAWDDAEQGSINSDDSDLDRTLTEEDATSMRATGLFQPDATLSLADSDPIPSSEPSAPSSESHPPASSASEMSIIVNRPRSALSVEELTQYNQLLAKSRALRASGQVALALNALLSAFDICDEDPSLQAFISSFSQQLPEF